MANVVQTFPLNDNKDERTRSGSPVAVAESGAGSAVSWRAIVGGAAATTALSLILLSLGTGLGFSMASPWEGIGTDAGMLGIAAILWITFTQIASAGLGGYLAGGLRTKWTGVHNHEVFLRDTANGFLAWAVSALLTVMALTAAAGITLRVGATATGAVITGASTAAAGLLSGKGGSTDATVGYFTDVLFSRRADATSPTSLSPGASAISADAPGDKARVRAEATHILVNDLSGGTLPTPDATYLGQLVAQNTGLSPQDAAQRVTETFASIKAKLADAERALTQAADAARKAAAYASLWLFVSLLSGAFVASLCATAGGHRRDLY